MTQLDKHDIRQPLIVAFSIPCRWNSTAIMFKSFIDTRPAVTQTLSIVDGAPLQFDNSDWKLMEKVFLVLKAFEEATKKLSHRDASISMTVPMVTSIKDSLELSVAGEDHGVRGMKRDLLNAMETRFAHVEYTDHFTVATLLDAKYKKHFFTEMGTLERSSNVIIDRIVSMLRKENQVRVNGICMLWHCHHQFDDNVAGNYFMGSSYGFTLLVRQILI